MIFALLFAQNYDLFRRFDAHFVSGADLEKYWADYSHIAHTCSLRSLVVSFQVFWRTLRFRSRSRKVLGRLQSYCTYMFSKVPSCVRSRKVLGRLQSYCTYFSKVPRCVFSGFFTLKLTQHFDLIYDIGKSDWKILRNIMKTAQDSYTITIKQIVRMHLEKI